MISIDFECSKGHRFEGFFKDHRQYKKQLDFKMITCPICSTEEIQRIYTGCSIQARPSLMSQIEKEKPDLFTTIQALTHHVKANFDYVGSDFPDVARSMHYGIEEERDIYGESSIDEIRELTEEGIEIIPLLDIDNQKN